MITIRIKWTAGRYHATPWGKHVNEGQVEWPPSPWRLLRALLATGFTKHHWERVPDVAYSLIQKLARQWPSYQLPPGQIGHSRHYMPCLEGKRQNTTKVIDTFVRLDPTQDQLLVQYPIELGEQERQMLKQLLADLSYLGRAESWVLGELVDDVQSIEKQNWCIPCDDNDTSLMRPGVQQIPVLGPLTSASYATWREQALEQQWQHTLEQSAAAKDKKPTKAQLVKTRKKIEAAYPQDLLACLLWDTSDFQKYGWSQAPGTQYRLYLRPAGTLESKPPRPTRVRWELKPVEAALINLASDTAQPGNSLPSFFRCLPQADLLHTAIISKLDGQNCPVLTGKDDKRNVLQHQHRHAHYLPLNLNKHGYLDHVLIYAPMKLDAMAQRALMRVQRTWTKGQEKPIVVTCAGLGSLDELRKQLKQSNHLPVPILSRSQTWVSYTPFVPVRYLKKSGKNSLENQVIAELQGRNMSNGTPFPALVDIKVLKNNELVDRKLLRFIRTRTNATKQPPVNCAFGIRLTFEQPVQGPIVLGYASHFGMGLFVPDNAT